MLCVDINVNLLSFFSFPDLQENNNSRPSSNLIICDPTLAISLIFPLSPSKELDFLPMNVMVNILYSDL